MLKKEVCKKCRQKFVMEGWTKDDEFWWSVDKDVLCLAPKSLFRKITDKPPDGCYYLLEHTI